MLMETISSRGKRVGYVRVSTCDQNPDRQLKNVTLDKTFLEHVSAKARDRPQLNAMLDYVREDDIVYVHSMDRLARTVVELKTIVDKLVKRGVKVVFLKEGLVFDTTDNPISNLTLSLMGAFAEFEYSFIRERQREGIAQAVSKGKYKGRKRSLSDDKLPEVRKMLQTNKPKTQICKDLNISRGGLYRYIKQYDLLNADLIKS